MTTDIDPARSAPDCWPPPPEPVLAARLDELERRVDALSDRVDTASKVWARALIRYDPELDSLAESNPPNDAELDDPTLRLRIDELVLQLRTVLRRHRDRAARAETARTEAEVQRDFATAEWGKALKQRDEARTRLAALEQAVAFETTCAGCAQRLAAMAGVEAERDRLSAALHRVHVFAEEAAGRNLTGTPDRVHEVLARIAVAADARVAQEQP